MPRSNGYKAVGSLDCNMLYPFPPSSVSSTDINTINTVICNRFNIYIHVSIIGSKNAFDDVHEKEMRPLSPSSIRMIDFKFAWFACARESRTRSFLYITRTTNIFPRYLGEHILRGSRKDPKIDLLYREVPTSGTRPGPPYRRHYKRAA